MARLAVRAYDELEVEARDPEAPEGTERIFGSTTRIVAISRGYPFHFRSI